MSAELNNDLVRLCVLLHTKNELQSQRHRARHAEQRFAHAQRWKQVSKQKKQLTKNSDASTNGHMVKLQKISQIAKTLPTWLNVNIQCERAINAVTDEIAGAKKQLGNIYVPREDGSSAKLRKMKLTDLTILKREQHIANETAKLNIAKFTREFRKEIADIAKRNGWSIAIDNYNGYYIGVRNLEATKTLYANTQRVHGDYDKTFVVNGRDAIATVAASQFLETAMVTS
jgi:hypothetical protein